MPEQDSILGSVLRSQKTLLQPTYTIVHNFEERQINKNLIEVTRGTLY